MKKYKVCVYAISKNEEKFCNRFMDTVKDADAVYVLDTGSTDKTVEILKKRGANVKVQEIKPWRFDTARNLSLAMVPDDCDICICLDLDEILVDGWRKELESAWENSINRLYYTYNWRLDKNDHPLVSFYVSKIHSRHGFYWKHPVHEVLIPSIEEKILTTDKLIVNHYPDDTKSRGSYLPLLELSVQEDPSDDRNMHYLGREYMYYEKWNESIDTLIKHLNLPSATWKDERCASMRFISRDYIALKRYKEAEMWLELAIKEAPYLKEPYVEMALLQYNLKNDSKVIKYLNKAAKIKENPKSYIQEVFTNDETIDDLYAISYYNIGKYSLALTHAKKALQKNKENKRLQENVRIIKEKLNQYKTINKQ